MLYYSLETAEILANNFILDSNINFYFSQFKYMQCTVIKYQACCWIRVDKEIWFISLFKREMVPLSIRACSVMNTKFWAALWRVNRSDVAKHDSFWLDLLYCFDNDRPQPLVSLVLIIQCAPCQLWYHNFVYIQSFNV